jgi:hypothetical protein
VQAIRLTLLGMFTIDPQTHMTWFQPGSFEPPWKFQMLGILFSLAVYNVITLPITFPLAFYDPRVEGPTDYDPIDYIKDGIRRRLHGYAFQYPRFLGRSRVL